MQFFVVAFDDLRLFMKHLFLPILTYKLLKINYNIYIFLIENKNEYQRQRTIHFEV